MAAPDDPSGDLADAARGIVVRLERVAAGRRFELQPVPAEIDAIADALADLHVLVERAVAEEDPGRLDELLAARAALRRAAELTAGFLALFRGGADQA